MATKQETIDRLVSELGYTEEQAKEIVKILGPEPSIIADTTKSTQSVKSLTDATVELSEAFLGLNKSSAAFSNFAQSRRLLEGLDEVSRVVAERLLSVADRSLELSVNTEETQASFNKLTGQLGNFNQALSEGFVRNVQFGGTLRDSSTALQAVLRNTTEFTRMSGDQQDALVDTMIVLEKFGVSQFATAEGFEMMTRGMGMSDEAARETFPNMVAMAAEMGMEARELTSQFTRNADKFAVFGDQGVHHFRRLAAESRRSGVSMENMVNVTAQFDTFTGAADKVQELNALLGGTYLDTIDMMMTVDPTERMLKIRGAVEDAGFTQEKISAMGETQAYYFRSTLAERMGMSVLDFNKLMSESGEEFAKNATAASTSLEELEGATKFGRTTADQINILKDQAAVGASQFITPVREVAKEFALEITENVYGPMAEENAEFFAKLGQEGADGLRGLKDQAVGYAVEFSDSVRENLFASLELMREFETEARKIEMFSAPTAGAAGAAAAAVVPALTGTPAGAPITVENLQLKIDGRGFLSLLDGQIANVVMSKIGLGG